MPLLRFLAAQVAEYLRLRREDTQRKAVTDRYIDRDGNDCVDGHQWLEQLYELLGMA